MDLLFDTIERTLNGPPISKKDFAYKLVPKLTRDKLKEHGLEGSFDPNNPINTDLGLAKEFYKAGLELAVEMGLFCPDTERRIIYTEREIRERAASAPTSCTLGYGADQVTIRSRKPEDGQVPVAEGSALGMSISEEYALPICMAIAQYRVVDIMLAPVLDRIAGHEIRSRSPAETIMGMYEARMMKEAVTRVGRPGMPLHGAEGAPTEYGHFGSFLAGGFDPKNTIGIALLPEPVDLPYGILHRIVTTHLAGAPLEAGHMLNIGGPFGSPEGATIGAVATQLLENASAYPCVVESTILDGRHFSNTTGSSLWASALSMQSRALGNGIMNLGITSQVSGPVTDMLLYETATITIADAVSGTAIEIGTRPTGCRYKNYGSALENKFFAEVLKSSAKNLKLSDANEIVKAILPKYETKFSNPPIGKPFPETTDLKTLQPTAEWMEIYERVWKELEDLGLPRWK
ncbi:MAG: monomethylamine:corrinoid methyltransferase [Conexivisphaerales archaeon]